MQGKISEGLKKERENNNTGSNSKFSKTEAIGVEFQQFVAEVIRKVRIVVKMFRKSPLKDEILQKHIQAQLNTELKLILD